MVLVYRKVVSIRPLPANHNLIGFYTYEKERGLIYRIKNSFKGRQESPLTEIISYQIIISVFGNSRPLYLIKLGGKMKMFLWLLLILFVGEFLYILIWQKNEPARFNRRIKEERKFIRNMISFDCKKKRRE